MICEIYIMVVSTKQPLKIAIIIGIITVLGISMSIVVSDSDADRTVGYAPLVSDVAVFAQYDKPYDVVVLGNDKTAAYLVDRLGAMNGAQASIQIEESSRLQLYVMTSGWVVNNNAEQRINNILDSGNIVSLLGTAVDWSKIDHPISHPCTTPDAFAMKLTPTGVSCFSIIGSTESEAYDRMIAWTDSVTKFEPKATSSLDIPIGTGIESNHEMKNPGYGTTSIRTVYYKLSETNAEYDYYLARYYATLEPESGSFNSGLDFKSVMDGGMMLRHGPGSTIGTNTVSVNNSYSIGTDGVSFTNGTSWSYEVKDVVVKDFTQTAKNILDIDHDVNEAATVGYTTFFAEPGKLVKLNSSQSYFGVDTYKSQFCHKILNRYCQYDDTEASYEVSF